MEFKLFLLMLLLRILCCILCTIYTVSGALDHMCAYNCSCCIDKECGAGPYFSDTCLKGCIDGHRGARCYELCQYENCKNCWDDVSYSRVCKECYDGYYLGPNKDCTRQCPSNCKSCNSSTMCTECREGFYNENGSTTCPYAYCPVNCGDCITGQGHCVSCKKGFYDTFTSCNKKCPANCLTCESEESCNECKSGFYNGYEYDSYINLPLNNCSYACRDTCTQCQSYNICLQCMTGRYGSTCHEYCSVGCKDTICSVVSGNCDCTNYFTGDKCIECVDGKYGHFCNQTCSKYCNGQICERSAGKCIHGCTNENITGSTCNTCILGMYGDLCNMVCPNNCRNNKCERYSGNCNEGCKGNFNGTVCDLCIQGKYGENCELKCPIMCKGNICEKKSGICYDCNVNFQRKRCTECVTGNYGPNCDEPCSKYCANKTCDRNTGKCIYGCINGYSGDRCCLKSENCLECTNKTACKKCSCGFFTNSCNKRCPKDCSGSCNILTGECSNCPVNNFGQFCESTCSSRCKLGDTEKRACSQTDGTCSYGCNDGYFGHTCNNTCSYFCVGGLCMQVDGVCVHGCEGHQEEPECFISKEQKSDDDGANKTITFAILGSLCAVAVIIIIIQTVFILLLKRRKDVQGGANRQQLDATYENQIMSSPHHVHQINETTTVSANRTVVYEVINRAHDADHEYQKISTIQPTPEV